MLPENNVNQTENQVEQPKKKGLLAKIISFFKPGAGLLFFLHYDNKDPEQAKSIGKAAIAGKIVQILIPFIVLAVAIPVCWLILKSIT